MGVTSEISIQTPREGKHITGEPIKGIVRFILDEDTVYKKISLSLVQKGFCKGYENELSYNARSYTIQAQGKAENCFMVEGNEKNLITKIYFLNKHADENTTVRAGSHEHAFQITIPEDVPASMKTDVGEITYNLVLKFKKPRFFRWNKIFKSTIIIHPRIDPSTEGPLYFAFNKTLTKLFSTDEQEINITGELDKGYLNPSGERKITFVATNNSDVTFSVRTELISKTTYKDDVVKHIMLMEPKTVREVIDSSTVETPSVPGNSVANMFNIIPVPPELCTVRHSKMISREYKLKVTLRLPTQYININSSVDIPVFIGESLRSRDEEEVDTSVPLENPPSYWEAMIEDKSKK